MVAFNVITLALALFATVNANELLVSGTSVINQSIACWTSHLEWSELITPQIGSVGAAAGQTVTVTLWYKVASTWDPMKQNITACPIPDARFVATWPAKPVALDPRCKMIGRAGNNVYCSFGKVAVDELLEFNQTLLIGEGQPKHGVMGFTWAFFDQSIFPPQPQFPVGARYGLDATGGINLGLPQPFVPSPTPPAGFDQFVLMTPKSFQSGSTAGAPASINVTIGVDPKSNLAAKNLQVMLDLFFDAQITKVNIISLTPRLSPGSCTLLMENTTSTIPTNPPSFDCRLGAIPIGGTLTIVVEVVIPKSAGEIISVPGMRSTPGWGASGWDLDAPSGSYPGKTCREANMSSPGSCPSGWAMNGIVDINGSVASVADSVFV